MKEDIVRYTRQAAQALAQADRERKLQALADALGILRALTADRAEGETAGEHLARYLSELQDALWDLQEDEAAAADYWELVGLYKDLFVTYYHVNEFCPPGYGEEYLIQVGRDGTAYRLDRGKPRWEAARWYTGFFDDDCVKLSRQQAEELEDEWNRPFWEQIGRDLSPRIYRLSTGKCAWTELRIEEGKVFLHGEDWSPACRDVTGRGGYEYHISLDADNSRRLMTQLRLDLGLHAPIEVILRETFGKGRSVSVFTDYCRSRSIGYKYV